MAERRLLSPDTLPQTFGHSQLVDVQPGRILFLSNQVPLDGEGRLVGEGDFAAQVRQVFVNLGTELEAAGAGWEDVVQLSFYVTDLGEVDALREIRDEHIDLEETPASTLVQVDALLRPDYLFEADAVAIVD